MKNAILHALLFATVALSPAFATAQTAFVHPWQNKRVAYFGDSVTDPDAPGGKFRYWSVLEERLGTKSYVYAVNGRDWTDIPRQTEQLAAEHGQDFDAILIFIGTNDFNAGVPIGEWYAENVEKTICAAGKPRAEQVRRHRTLVTGNTTLCGRINTAMKKIKSLFPSKQVVLLTPIHRAYAEFGDSNVQPSEEFQNSCGEWFSAYVEAVKQAGNVWAVPVVDLNSASGLYPLCDEQVSYFCNAQSDRLHPNAEGHKRLGETLVYGLLALPCTF